MRKAAVFIFFLLLACSKDAPVPEEPSTVNYTVAVSASEGGSVNSPGGSYAQNATITLTATAADGFVFSGWSGDVTGTTNPLSYTVTANASIVANFTRSNYSFNIQTSGQGSVAEELVSSSKSKTDYESGSTVRLTATPETGWLFYRWEGLARGFTDAATGQEEVSVDFDNPIEVEVNSSINATGTFEQIISENDNPTSGVGKWKIRKKSVSSKSDKSLLVDCDITEIIFRTDATFSIFTSTATISGQYVFDSNTSISLSQSNSPFGTITNIVISNSFISFSIDINNGCNDDLDGDKDDDYIESEDPITGTVASATCTITSSLDSGLETQTVTQTNSIQDIVYYFSTTCTETLSANADNLPPGVTMTFSNNQATLSGAPSGNASGTYDYTIFVTTPNIATTVSGQISVSSQNTVEEICTSASIELISGSLNQSIILGDSIQQTVLQLTTNCTDDDNGVPLNSAGDNFPNGVIYSFDGVNNRIIISGTPTSPGTHTFSLKYYNNQTIESSTVSVVVIGQLTVVANTTTSTSTTACSISAVLQSGSGQASQNVNSGQAIQAIGYDITSNCQVLSAQAYNLPPGITLGTNFQEAANSNTLNISGTPSSSASGTYNYDIVVSEASTTNSITLSGTITVASSVASNSGNIYFENGTCKCPNATVGDTADISGVTYTVVDNSTIAGEIANGNVNLCTTLVTSMTDLFKDNTSFNSDIGFWDTSNVTLMSSMFANATTFNQDIGSWDVSNVTDMAYLFYVATAFDQDIGNWNVSNVTSMYYLFTGAENFNQNLNSWNVTNVTNMTRMFQNASAFNQPIGSWDTSQVVDMMDMFQGAAVFNQDIDGWDVSSVTNMGSMFAGALAFNKPLGSWNISSVINTSNMFDNAVAFNQPLSNWNMSSVTNTAFMFKKAESFNQDISVWDTSSVTLMNEMFREASVFNQNIGNWDTSSVTDMNNMFNRAFAFDKDLSNWDTSSVTNMNSMFVSTNSTPNIGGWDVSNVTDMGGIFNNANYFNDNISSWDTSNVTNMESMFRDAGVFNQSIGNWDTSAVTNMERMFRGAPSFNQDLKGWCVSNITSEPELFTNEASALVNTNKPLWGKEFTVALTTGSNSQTVTATNAITDIVYTATPICSGSISAAASGLPSGVSMAFANNVATISGSANATGTFAYALTFTGASTSQEVTGTITVNAALTADTTPPVISLLGSSTINLTVGDTFTDPGATATDNVDGDITSSISISGSVNTATAGTYVLTYLVSDSSGNQDEVRRTIIVSAAASSYSISVTASSNADYTLSGTDANGTVSGNDVSITINAGDTLNFNVDASSHPFYIKTAQGTGTDNQASGVSNNGATNGTVTWTPTAAGTYYYQCSAHNGMYGTIIVQ